MMPLYSRSSTAVLKHTSDYHPLFLPPSLPHTCANPPLHSSQPIRIKNVSPYPGYQSGWGRTIATAGWTDSGTGMTNTGGGVWWKPCKRIDVCVCVSLSYSGGSIFLRHIYFIDSKVKQRKGFRFERLIWEASAILFHLLLYQAHTQAINLSHKKR